MISYTKEVAFSVTNCICNDQRVQKIAHSVNELGYCITIIGRKTRNCKDLKIDPFRIYRFKMLFSKGLLFYKFYNIRLFIHLLFHKYDLLVANDLDTLLPNYLVSKLKQIPLVYDSHEYFTGVPEIQKRPFVKWVWTKIEKSIFPDLNHVMTVSNSIASQYEKEYFIRPLVIMNAGVRTDKIKPYTREESGLPADDLILIIHGTGINIDRGAEELVEALTLLEGVTLLIVGSGDVIPQLKQKVKDMKTDSRIRFIPTVPWNDLIRYIKMADIGMSLDKDTSLNYRFSLPNKLFDYISAGIPFIAGNLFEPAKIIREFNCGVLIDKITPQSIKSAIDDLKNHPEKLITLTKNAKSASLILNWENEEKKVAGFYKRIICNNPVSI
jgi:glycosyltransferase involved in cell wall biosynthesis